ncbi:MAG: hypothetical protein KGI33_06905 [Thaumarchaeota archaeon]|nr:hypothetical protein [Nitrososphaerota archaeon]
MSGTTTWPLGVGKIHEDLEDARFTLVMLGSGMGSIVTPGGNEEVKFLVAGSGGTMR